MAADSGLIAQVLDRDFVLRHLELARAQLAAAAAPAGGDAAGDAEISADEAAVTVREIARAQGKAAADAAGEPGSATGGPDEGSAAHAHGAFISSDPLVSCLQTALERRIEERFGDWIEHRDAAGPAPGGTRVVAPPADADAGADAVDEHVGVAFTHRDPRWAIEIGKALVQRVAHGGRHDFNDQPAVEVPMGAGARVVILGDWGTGLDRALEVSRLARQRVLEARGAGRDVHVIHLGDVYYSGERDELARRMLAPDAWPVQPEEAGEIGSWALNGNHDMYCGGDPYFEYLLGGDERFARQRSADGAGSSFFDIVSDDWRIVGLDSSWQDDILRHAGAGELAGNQAAHVEQAAAKGDGRKLLLLTHHQYVSAYEQIGSLLGDQLAPALASGRVRAWMWGHEHRCLTYDPRDHLPFAACIGHGGVPQIAHAEKAPLPAPGQWEFRGQFESGGRAWTRYGFAVLDFDGPAMSVTFVDELGQTRPPITVV